MALHEFLRGQAPRPRANPPLPVRRLLSPPVRADGAVHAQETTLQWQRELSACSPPEIAASIARLLRRTGQALGALLTFNLLCDRLEYGTVEGFADAARLWREGLLRDALGESRPWRPGGPALAGLIVSTDNLLTLLESCTMLDGRWVVRANWEENLYVVLAPALDALSGRLGWGDEEFYAWAQRLLEPRAPRLLPCGLRVRAAHKAGRVELFYDEAARPHAPLARADVARASSAVDTRVGGVPRTRVEPIDRVEHLDLFKSGSSPRALRAVGHDLVLRGVRRIDWLDAHLADRGGIETPLQDVGWSVVALPWTLTDLRTWPSGVEPTEAASEQGARLLALVEDAQNYTFLNAPPLAAAMASALAATARALRGGADVELDAWLTRLTDPSQPVRLIAADWAEPWSALGEAGALGSGASRALLAACHLLSDGLEGTDRGPATVLPVGGGVWRTSHQGTQVSVRSLQRCLAHLLDVLLGEGAALSADEAVGMLRMHFRPDGGR